MIPILVIAGPTASGKTRLAIELAQKLGGEIINADSRQFYRGMDIGTAKPTPAEQHAAQHHLIDVADINQPWSVGDFVREARHVISRIHENKKLPIVCGGTGMYVQALLEGLDEIPEVPAEIMTQLMTRLEHEGLAALYAELRHKDLAAAEFIGKTNTQRILRAMGVLLHTGKSITTFWSRSKKNKDNDAAYDALQIFLDLPREIVTQRIDARVDEMLKRGLREEARALWQRYPESPLLSRTIGYAEWLQDSFEKEDAVAEKIKTHTRQFAKRQVTWWRRIKDVHWVKAGESEKMMSEILSLWSDAITVMSGLKK